MKSELRKKLTAKNPEAVLFDNRVDSALVGIGCVGPQRFVAVYSKQAIIEALFAHGINKDDVGEYYGWHFSGICAGVNTPVILDDCSGAI